jgi:hypothetical protein
VPGGINGPPTLDGAQYIYPSKTLSELRDELLTMLGFPDPLTALDSETKTLVELREDVIRRAGHRYSAGANSPGLDELVDGWINEAQQAVFRMAELDKAGVAYPAVMTLDADPTEIDYVPVLTLAIAYSKAHYEQPDARVYFEQLSKYMSDRVARRPPNIVAMCNQWLQVAQNQLYNRYRMLRSDRWWTIPISQGNRIYDVPSVSSEPQSITFAATSPATITRAAGSWLTDGFLAGHRIKALGAANAGNNNTQWTIASLTATVITLAAGDVVVAEGPTANVTVNTANYLSLNFRQCREAWLLDDTQWLPLIAGINPMLFSLTTQSLPTHYELREFFEIFPAPNKAYTAYLRGHFGLMPFTADTDKTSIDPEPILLQALAWGSARYRPQEAGMYKRELETLVGHLNAGKYDGRRFIPASSRDEPLPLTYPQVTFPRI